MHPALRVLFSEKELTGTCKDLKSILWLERFLRESTNYSTLVLTSHDQVFLDRLTEQTITLRNQRLDYFDGTPSLMQSVEAEERQHKEKMSAALDKKKEHVSGRGSEALWIFSRLRMLQGNQKEWCMLIGWTCRSNHQYSKVASWPRRPTMMRACDWSSRARRS